MSEAAYPIAAGRSEALTGYRRVAAQLRQDILDGSAAPGAWLRMAAIALRCGVSVQPVREALQQLQGEGLVEIFPNRGARVRGLDRVRLLHIYEMREALESFMSRRFAEEASLSDLTRLEALQAEHDEAIAAGDLPGVSLANRAFHALINGHGGNGDVVELTARYSDLTVMLARRVGRGAAYFARVQGEHHALMDAFRRRDASAAADIGAAHVRGTRVEVLNLIERKLP